MNGKTTLMVASTPPPEECSCPDDLVNHLVAYRKPVIEDLGSKEQLLKWDSSEKEFYYPLPILDGTMGSSLKKLRKASMFIQSILATF